MSTYPLLCIDIGNTSIGFYYQLTPNSTPVCFKNKTHGSTQVTLEKALKNNLDNHQQPKAIAIASVVPNTLTTLQKSCQTRFPKTPQYLLQHSNIPLIIPVTYPPKKLGIDRIATALGALTLYPNTNLIVIDMGTATTIDAIDKNKHFLGGSILSGMQTSLEALSAKAAVLSGISIDTLRPNQPVLGKNTVDGLRSGAYYGQLGAIKEIIDRIATEYFTNDAYKIIATGGHAHYFKDEIIFNIIAPELIFEGLKSYLHNNVSI